MSGREAIRHRRDSRTYSAKSVTTVALLLDDLLTGLGAVPGAVGLLTGVAVYREPVDFNAVLFAAGQPDPAIDDTPDRAAAYQRIAEILDAAGIPVDRPVDLARVPADVRAELAPYLAELDRQPVPPFRASPGLAGQVDACRAAGLVTVSGTGPEQRFFVHRWTATEVAARQPSPELAARQPSPELAATHRQAAAYWQWRVQAWPQDRADDVHDLLEAGHHLLAAVDTDAAIGVTWPICEQLHIWGAWDQEAVLIHDTLARLPDGSADQAAWLRQLGWVADQRGDYDQAERHYQRALDIFERLGDQAGLADSISQLGNLDAERGAPPAAVIAWHVTALAIRLRLGGPKAVIDLRRLAALRNDLGIEQFTALLIQAAGDADQAQMIMSLLDQLEAAAPPGQSAQAEEEPSR